MTALAITEADWQQQVIDLAHLTGWHHLHIRRSIGHRGKPTPEQTAVLASLSAAGVECHVMWPTDLERLQAILSGASNNGSGNQS